MVAAVAAAAALTCRPAPGLGTLTYTRGKLVHVLDLSTCRDRTAAPGQLPATDPLVSPNGALRASVHHDRIVATNLRTHRSTELLRGQRAVMLVGWSPDSRWILFAIDPMASASIAADGLRLRAVSVDAAAAAIAPMLMYDDYRTWCDGRLVMTAGGDRIATTNKRLLAARIGGWRPRPLLRAPGRAWGSVACGADRRSVVVQSQPASGPDMSVDHSHWSLWRVGFDGSRRRLTSPPAGFSDDSPLVAGDAVFFVRSQRGSGRVYAHRGGKVYGPFATLDANPGYYGHRAWDFRVTR